VDNKQEFKKPIQTSILKLGKRTFFFDVNIASNNKKYLKVTESRLVGDNGETKRSSFVLFPEDVTNFQTSLVEMVGHLA
jgi:hypothetical protein